MKRTTNILAGRMVTNRMIRIALLGVGVFVSASIAPAQPATSQPVTQPATASGQVTPQISNAWARPSRGAMNISGAFLTIQNPGSVDLKLTGVLCPACKNPELHTTEVDAQGVMHMRKVDSMPIPAGKSLELKPGSNHIMLIGMQKPTKAGEKIAITLVFENDVKIPVELEVKE